MWGGGRHAMPHASYCMCSAVGLASAAAAAAGPGMRPGHAECFVLFGVCHERWQQACEQLWKDVCSLLGLLGGRSHLLRRPTTTLDPSTAASPRPRHGRLSTPPHPKQQGPPTPLEKGKRLYMA